MNRRSFFGLLIAAICGPRIAKHIPDWFRIETNPADLYVPSNDGLYGLQYYQISGNAGMYMGLSRK